MSVKLRFPDPIPYEESVVIPPALVTSVIWSQLTIFKRGAKMKAKKAKPIPIQQQTLLVGRDYLSLLIRQLDLEIHVTNMIFRKFINPKVRGPR